MNPFQTCSGNEVNLAPAGPSEWGKFFDLLSTSPDIKPAARPHYARWVGDWLGNDGGASEAATRGHFEELGRRPGLKDWQFRQAVRAVRYWVSEIVRLPWAASFDWDGLAAQSVALGGEHRTLLRETIGFVGTASPLGYGGSTRIDHTPAPGERAAIERLVARARQAIRLAGLAVATEGAYISWVKRFCRFRMRRLRQGLDVLEAPDIARYLEYLALERQVSIATQKQALNALVFLARKVYELKELDLEYTPTPRKGRRPPTVLTREEVKRVIANLRDP